ncbi:sulfurtransferase [Gemmatimonas sp. UBA7669]|jgi:thiosulfate/3-mercaptopyruvate sulfurtransferase|uniref:sulfurtransferase n=1 Tax=Gemmatimonas sp. UBA7669 TaxID=1946568 RepID=UPI0025B89257|nr:rhodanese-like domain-containing protein [Gemmatimonas sp. UBA7669]
MSWLYRLPSHTRSLSMLLAVTAALATTATAQRAPAPIQVVDGAWLAAHLDDADLVVLQVEMDTSAKTARIPGARMLPYRALVMTRDGLSSELPSPDSLASLFSGLGIAPGALVVATTTHEPPMAARALMTLDVMGHPRLAFLAGGVAQWKRDGRPLATAPARFTRSSYPVRPAAEVVVNAEWIAQRQGRGIALIDTRTDGEFDGTGNRSGMPSDGHPAGARQLQWEQVFANVDLHQLQDSATLRRLYTERMRGGDTLVTYCWVGYRASMTYVAARTLGLPVRLYDGSYQDWQRRGLPVLKGSDGR